MQTAPALTADGVKARGGFYTPREITRFLVEWAVRSGRDRALEPSCGDGAFLASLSERYAQLTESMVGRVVGVERDVVEAEKARTAAPDADIHTTNFFDLEPESLEPFEAVVGNPPYIRYHGFNGADRAKALGRAAAQGVTLTGLASSWAHFVIHGAAFLKSDGRMALVLPAELLHSDYGRPVRDFLLKRFGSVVIVAFDRMIFADAQVDAVLLLASSDDHLGLRVVRTIDELSLSTLELRPQSSKAGSDHLTRWSAVIDSDASRLYESYLSAGCTRLGEVGSVDIGFVTGSNDYFVLSEADARLHELPQEVLTPAVRRPRDVPGLEVGWPNVSWLLDLAGRSALEPAVERYVAKGVSTGVANRYKCRTRKPWFAVPLPRQRADAFIPYMAHAAPRLIVNGVGARSTNLLHGVALREGVSAKALAVAMCSSLTLLSAEIEGRAYGGGVLKLETREAERLVVPAVDPRLQLHFDHVNALILSGDVKSAAEHVDGLLGLDHDALWSTYLVFRDRRLNRR